MLQCSFGDACALRDFRGCISGDICQPFFEIHTAIVTELLFARKVCASIYHWKLNFSVQLLRQWRKVCNNGAMSANFAPIRIKASVLDQARKLHGLTSDEQLGAELGLSGTTVRNLRHGRTSPTLATVLKISRLAGVPIEGLIVERVDESAA